MNALRKIAVGSLAAVLACSMAACGSGNANSTDSASNTGKTVKVDEKSAKATSISDFGGMDGLVAAAEKEGALNAIALPHDWSNYGDVISGFKKKYPKTRSTSRTRTPPPRRKWTPARPTRAPTPLRTCTTSAWPWPPPAPTTSPRTRCRPGTRSGFRQG